MIDNQRKQIIDYMKQFGSITQYQAFMDLGITKLASRISELRENGNNIETTMMSGVNRLGRKIRYARYTLHD